MDISQGGNGIMTEEVKWPYNSELYLTFREVRREMPKLNLTFDFNLTKPTKPSEPDTPPIQ